MKLSKTIAITSLALLAAAGAQAETYQGVHMGTSSTSSKAATENSVEPGQGGDAYAEGRSSGVTSIAGKRERASVLAEAVSAAYAPNQNYHEAVATGAIAPEVAGAAAKSAM